MKKTINQLSYLLFLGCSFSYGQMEKYDYKREIHGITEPWHQIDIPTEVFSTINQNASDIRIFGITKENDTIEAAYFIRKAKEKSTSKEVPFKILNTSYTDEGYFYTFENTSQSAVNQIELDFEVKNFDWRLELKGSQNQNDWFTITENQRILSIKNQKTDFKFTTLSFPSAQYTYFRLRVNSKENPNLLNAKVKQRETIKGDYREFSVEGINTKEDKSEKQTEITINLEEAAPVSKINIDVLDTFDYYRPIVIKYLKDSIQTEKGYIYNYQELSRRTLNSMSDNEFNFNSTTLQELKILVQNQDNQALNFGDVKVKGFVYQIIARFTKKATYFLVYGNPKVSFPDYDIKQFESKIPKDLIHLNLGKEQSIDKPDKQKTAALFENKTWLWLVIILIIGILGWFSIQMMRKQG